MGNEFRFLEKIVIQSHLKVGHEPVIWLCGKSPNNKYWNEIESIIKLKNSDDICSVDDFIKTGGNFRTAASLWRFTFLYEKGGLYCDTDAFALKKFPDDTDWILASPQAPKRFSLGVLKAPPKQEVFRECIKLAKKEWGNVKLFSDKYLKIFGNKRSTHENELFYPYVWNECYRLFRKMDIPKNSYSIHFYGLGLKMHLKNGSKKSPYRPLHSNEPKTLSDLNEKWCEKNSNTLLGQLWKWLQE